MRGVQVVAYTPDPPSMVRIYARIAGLDFPIAAGAQSALRSLGQRAGWLPLSRMPGLVGVASDGTVRYVHAGRNPADLPDLSEALRALLQDHPPGHLS